MKKIGILGIFVLFIFIGCGEKKIEFYGYEVNSKIDKSTVEKGESGFPEYVLYTPKIKDKMFDEVKIFVDNEEKIKQIYLTKECKKSENPYIYQKEILNKLTSKFGEFSCKEIPMGEFCESKIIANFRVDISVFGDTLYVNIIQPKEKENTEGKAMNKF